ncbi:DDE-type integrase/transposase/recombinase [Agrobacterium sp. V1]|uniref:DDE-type integrase/transposase/recombinase n=1 Tax=Agrobacterium sp. V1 TaxID=3061957 RepID=UPI002672DA9C|nr:DDE-type integrase/transposase/recombinase [Agrobacterium sp. V1]MDO3442889.1 DDE-type integrase/transposase/recombinase [Agrobacterium sp. V1]
MPSAGHRQPGDCRLWINRFGRHFTNCIRSDRPKPDEKRHMDEAVITVGGKKFWLWRAIDANGDVLDILVQYRCNSRAARRFFGADPGHRSRCRASAAQRAENPN